jgi:hypothetical protein
MTPIRYFVACALLLGGCTSDSTDAPAGTTAAARTATVDLTIGQEDGDDAYMFGRVGGVATDDEGRIYVVDHAAAQVRVFDSSGVHTETFGRPGSGPGELRDPCCLAIGPDGHLWVRDNGNNRYVSFKLAAERGTAGPSTRMAHTDVNLWAPVTFDDSGAVIDVGMRFDQATNESRLYRFHLTPDSARTAEPRAVPIPEPAEGAVAVAKIQFERGDTRGIRYVYQPYGPMHLTAHGPNGEFADAISGEYRIKVYNADGTVARTIARAGTQGPMLTAAQRASGDSTLARTAEFVGKSVSDLPFTVPERNLPLAALAFDERGRLLVFLTGEPGTPRIVHVYDRAGVHVETLELPRAVTFSATTTAFRGDRVVATMTDSLDIPYVVRLRVR